MRKATLKFSSGDPVFDLSRGEITQITYHYYSASDIRDRAISEGFSTADLMIKPRGFDLHVPTMDDDDICVSSPVTGAKFISDLNDARRGFNDEYHNVRLRKTLGVKLAIYDYLFSFLLLECLQTEPI